MVRANCRVQFTKADIEFLLSAASKETRVRVGSRSDLNSSSIDQLVDDEHVFRQIYGHREFFRVSPHFFFYLGTRWCMREYGLDDRDLADYVASILCAFLRTEDLYRTSVSGEQFVYLVDMVEALNETARYEDVFDHHAHIGNYTLFLVGIFPDYLEYLSTYKRRLITRRYYEMMGQTHYKMASSHEVARKEQLDEILSALSSQFIPVRRALNRLSVQYLIFNRSEAQRTYLTMLNEWDV